MAVSLSLMALQPRPCLLGYSQLLQKLDTGFQRCRTSFQGNILKIETIEIVLLDQVRDGLDKGSAVLSRANACGEIARACPAANGDESFHILKIMLAAIFTQETDR